jgi:hypothetical protein
MSDIFVAVVRVGGGEAALRALMTARPAGKTATQNMFVCRKNRATTPMSTAIKLPEEIQDAVLLLNRAP